MEEYLAEKQISEDMIRSIQYEINNLRSLKSHISEEEFDDQMKNYQYMFLFNLLIILNGS